MSPGLALRIRHVCFDLDGTLVDSRADIAEAMNRVLVALGRTPLDLAVLQSFVGEGARRLVERALGGAPATVVDDGLARFMDQYGAHLLDRTLPYPGIEEMLDALVTRGVVLTVVSNKPEAMSRAILEGLGLGGHFRAVRGGDSLPTRKPDPAGVEWARAAAGAHRAETILVGDSGIDVRTARAAGVAFCGVSWGLTPEGMWAENPAQVVDHPAALLAVVGD